MKLNFVVLLIVAFCVLYKLIALYRTYKPHFTTVLLPEGHRKIDLCWWSYYDWYDIRGMHMWSRRIKRKTLFTI